MSMNKLKPYLSTLLESSKAISSIVIVMILIADLLRIGWTLKISNTLVEESVSLVGIHISIIAWFMFLSGMSSSLGHFKCFISIRAQRGYCLLSLGLWGIGVLVSVTLINFLGLNGLIGLMKQGGKEAIFSYMTIKQAMLSFWIFSLCRSIGFLGGAIYYRISKWLWRVLIVATMFVLINSHLKEVLLTMTPGHYLIAIMSCLIGGVLLLRKAPIESYAHDLL